MQQRLKWVKVFDFFISKFLKNHFYFSSRLLIPKTSNFEGDFQVYAAQDQVMLTSCFLKNLS